MIDPDDLVYRQFLQGLFSDQNSSQGNQNDPSKQNVNNAFSSNSAITSHQIDAFNILDDADDPDFTAPIDYTDLQDFNDNIQVPKHETLDLLKDTIDILPSLFPDETRSHKKHKSNTLSRRCTQDSLIVNQSNQQTTSVNSLLSDLQQQQQQQQQRRQEAETRTGNLVNFDDYTNKPTTSSRRSNENEPRFTPAEFIDTSIATHRNNEKSQTSTAEINNRQQTDDVAVISGTESGCSSLSSDFTSSQRELLDEQLRNHVQMVTQISLLSYCCNEFRAIYDEGLNLLKNLDELKRTPALKNNADITTKTTEESSSTDEIAKKQMRMLVSSEFKIMNLIEAIGVLESAKNLDSELVMRGNMNQWSKMPPKYLEILITCPVFYNTSLLPNINKFGFHSLYRRSNFSDTEKILLTLGFGHFKHLEKGICCQCIHDSVLPHRSCDDIKKQIQSISNKESLQAKIKELVQNHKHLSSIGRSRTFSPHVHYKSPYEQVDEGRVQLPTMYTTTLERLKFLKLQQEVKVREAREKSILVSSGKENNITPQKSTNKQKQALENSVNKTPQQQQESHHQGCFILSDAVSSPLDSSIEEISVVEPSTTTKRRRTESGSTNSNQSPPTSTQIPGESLNQTPKTLRPKPSVSQTPSSSPPVYIFTNPTQQQMMPGQLFLQPNTSNKSNSLVMNPLALFPNTSSSSSMSTNTNTNTQSRSQMPFCLPPGFAGTIIINPTIHVHLNKNEPDMSQYKEIKPKDAKLVKKD